MDTKECTVPDRMIDLATPVRGKALARAIFWSLFALLTLVGPVLFLVVAAVGRSLGVLGSEDVPAPDLAGAVGGLLAVVLIGWPSAATAIHRFWAARAANCYLRAGPDGLSLRIPGGLNWEGLWLKFHVIEAEVPWSDLRDCTTMHVWNSVGENYLVLEVAGAGRYQQAMRWSREDLAFAALTTAPRRALYVHGFLFAESVREIARRANDLAARYGPATPALPAQGHEGACPRCGFAFAWDGTRCRHCRTIA